MTKYVKYLLMFMCFLFVCSVEVNAADSCPSDLKKELSQTAAHIKVNYEIQDKSETKDIEVNGTKTTYKVPNYAFVISIYNLTKDFTAKVQTNSSVAANNKYLSVYYDETVEGNYSLYDYNIGEVYNYTITIQSNNPDCPNKVFRTFRITKPKYNAYSEYTYCQNSSNYYCQRFVSNDLKIKDTADFIKRIAVNNEKNNPNKGFLDANQEIKDTLKKNWPLYLAIFAGIALVIIATIFYLKKRQRKKGWKI